jgi:hypothetical protein
LGYVTRGVTATGMEKGGRIWGANVLCERQDVLK